MLEANVTKLKQIIMKYSKKVINENDIVPSSNLVNDFGYDSVQLIDLVVEIESEFDIRIEDDDLDLGILVKYETLKEFISKKIDQK